MVQWLRLHAPKAGGPGSISDQATKIWLAATKTGAVNNNNNNNKSYKETHSRARTHPDSWRH